MCMMQFTEISFKNPKFRQKSSLSQIKKEETQLLKRHKIPELSNKIPDTRKGFGFFLEMEDYLRFDLAQTTHFRAEENEIQNIQ